MSLHDVINHYAEYRYSTGSMFFYNSNMFISHQCTLLVCWYQINKCIQMNDVLDSCCDLKYWHSIFLSYMYKQLINSSFSSQSTMVTGHHLPPQTEKNIILLCMCVYVLGWLKRKPVIKACFEVNVESSSKGCAEQNIA